jgi:hypothetical protein
MAPTQHTHAVNIRLPDWAFELLEERRASTSVTRTDVILEAINCLHERDLHELMAEGYREQAENARQIAESMLPAASDSLPEW